MDDTAYREFFELPTQTYHRRYEALRAVFVDQRSQKEVADEFQFTYGSLRQLVREFRRACHTENERTDSPFFEMSMLDDPSRTTTQSTILPLLTGVNLYSPRTIRYGSEQGRQECFCSCLCWPSWDSTSWR